MALRAALAEASAHPRLIETVGIAANLDKPLALAIMFDSFARALYVEFNAYERDYYLDPRYATPSPAAVAGS